MEIGAKEAIKNCFVFHAKIYNARENITRIREIIVNLPTLSKAFCSLVY